MLKDAGIEVKVSSPPPIILFVLEIFLFPLIQDKINNIYLGVNIPWWK